MLYQQLVVKNSYQDSIEDIRLTPVELQLKDCQVYKIKIEKLNKNQENFNKILYHYGLPYIFEIIRTKLIRSHYDSLLVGYFSIKKI